MYEALKGGVIGDPSLFEMFESRNTNVNIIPEKSSTTVTTAEVVETPLVESAPVQTTVTETTVVETAPVTTTETTITTEETSVPMTSAVQETTTTITTEEETPAPTRTRMRKD